MKRKHFQSKLAGALIVSAMVVLTFTGCGKNSKKSSGGIKEFTMFAAVPESEINNDNDIQKIIAEKTGVKVKETWLTGQTAQEAVGTLIAGGEYPDFIDGSDGMKQLYDAGALVQLDKYIDKYPNIKNYYTEAQWNNMRQDDGHIYWINQFQNIKNKDTTCTHNDEAFWIQTRVLKWANWPKIETLDEYFDLIERYVAANPTMEDGTKNIPYTILCEDWRYFCLENPGMFLEGYPNDGCVIVDPKTREIIDYNTTEVSKRYFKKLNEEYKKGIVDPESFTMTYDEYIAKLSSGRVCGMVDQWWDFAFTAGDAIIAAGLDKQGCSYVPLPITIDKGMKNQWHNSGGVQNVSSGIAITTSCKDVDGAMKFINDLLSQEIHDLRLWGVKDVDYYVTAEGKFMRTPEQRIKASEMAYKASHLCPYKYFPQYLGTSDDGINAMWPSDQPEEFFEGLRDDVKEAFTNYGAKTYVEMLGSTPAPGPWYPLWSFSNNFTTSTKGGVAWLKVRETKQRELPRVVMAKDFESAWKDYLKAYASCKPEDYLNEIRDELNRRIKIAENK